MKRFYSRLYILHTYNSSFGLIIFIFAIEINNNMSIIKWFGQTIVTYLYMYMHTILIIHTSYITIMFTNVQGLYLEYFKQSRLHDNTFSFTIFIIGTILC